MPPQNRANNLSNVNWLQQDTAHWLVQDNSYTHSNRALQRRPLPAGGGVCKPVEIRLQEAVQFLVNESFAYKRTTRRN